MEFVNKVITLNKTIHPKHNLLLDHHREIYDPILSCTNQEKLPIFCLSQPDENFQKFKVWESWLPFCVVPKVFHFLGLIKWCVTHYSNETRSVVTHNSSQIFITNTSEEIINMLGLHSTNFSKKNIVPLS